jgi:hypothetical protein
MHASEGIFDGVSPGVKRLMSSNVKALVGNQESTKKH